MYRALRDRHVLPELVGGNVAEDSLDVLPVLPSPWVHDAFADISPSDLERLQRYKIVPIDWTPTNMAVAVVDEAGIAEADRIGMPVVGRVDVSDFRSAFRDHFASSLLKQATNHLRRLMPEASASTRITPLQALWGSVAAILVFALYQIFSGIQIMLMVGCLCGLFFSLVIAHRILCLLPHVKPPAAPELNLDSAELPVYTVLVPLFRETRVLHQLVDALSALNYPANLLDIKLILEETDLAMQDAVDGLALPKYFDVIIVPTGFPQTKPRALNYAMNFARGSLVTIFDSEDIPEPSQLLKAAQQFSNAGKDVACLQARLRFFNPTENWLARQFSAEYATLFEVIIPSLASQGLPLLLGGTSNHFRVDYLERIGGWDPFNVTEDADLGLRLARMGYRSEVLDSTTYEEANTQLGNWLKQRRRWLKGFLQTWLIHNRHPIETVRGLGVVGFLSMQCMTLGVFVSALLHPMLFASGIWALLPSNIVHTQTSLWTSVLTGLDLFLLIAGYATAAIAMKRAMKRARLPAWSKVAMTLPVYWCLLSIAAWQAVFDFVFAPFHWHKTEHGLTRLARRRKAGQSGNPARPRRAIYSPRSQRRSRAGRTGSSGLSALAARRQPSFRLPTYASHGFPGPRCGVLHPMACRIFRTAPDS
jgi:cellulose synthase/poly-beta-1,6-N-acetylglucosamine synthase-like glycosyltransferase